MCPRICVDTARNWNQIAQSYVPQLSHLPTFLVNGRVQKVWSLGSTKRLHTWIVLVLVLIPRPQETLQEDHGDQRDTTQSTAASSVLALFSNTWLSACRAEDAVVVTSASSSSSSSATVMVSTEHTPWITETFLTINTIVYSDRPWWPRC